MLRDYSSKILQPTKAHNFDDLNLDCPAEKLSKNRDDPKWNWKYSLVMDLGAKNQGNYILPPSFMILHDKEILRLGKWLHYQLLLYKRNDPALYSERRMKIKHLIDIGKFNIQSQNDDNNNKTTYLSSSSSSSQVTNNMEKNHSNTLKTQRRVCKNILKYNLSYVLSIYLFMIYIS